MNLRVEIKNNLWNLYSPKIEMYVLENATEKEVKIALATEMEYNVKMKIVKLLMTFPHDFMTKDDQIIVHEDAVKEFENWHHKIHQRIVFPEEYHSLIDEKIAELLT